MRKLIAFSVLLVPLLIGFRFSKDTNPRRGLRRTVWTAVIFWAVWSLVGPPIYMASSSD